MKKQMPWFRFYTEALDDPKVQRLPPHLFKTWVNLLCLACANDGQFPSLDDISFRLRMSVHDVQQQFDELILAGLIDIRNDGKRAPHNWMKRQFVSDTSTGRVRKFRSEKKKQARNADETFHETTPDTIPDPETENLNPLPTEQEAAKESEVKNLALAGLGKGGVVSADARRQACQRLAIGNADPLVSIYERWPGSRSARDPDGKFLSCVAKLLRDAPPEVKAACQPLIAEPIPIPAPTVRASPQLAASLQRMRAH